MHAVDKGGRGSYIELNEELLGEEGGCGVEGGSGALGKQALQIFVGSVNFIGWTRLRNAQDG